MKIIIAPDSFKGSLSADKVCDAIEIGIRNIAPKTKIIKIPIADGGEGTVRALVHATNGQLKNSIVTGPLGNNVNAEWGVLGGGETAVIEMASASGLPLVPSDKRNPMETTTFGTGQLIKAAINIGCKKIILGIGGSATTDFGTGMAQALGVRFLKKNGRCISEFMNGRLMGVVNSIDDTSILPDILDVKIHVACDVENPLLGPNGAVYTYSPQKGADDKMCLLLENNMEKISSVVALTFKDVRLLPGAGAAGGLGGGLVAFLKAELLPGIKIVLDTVKFAEKIKNADYIITGEGKIDSQTIFGKTIAGVAEFASKQEIPVLALAGSVDVSFAELKKIGIRAAFSICNQPLSLEKAKQNTSHLLIKLTENVMSLIHKK
jgi:glycerate 2-kinase